MAGSFASLEHSLHVPSADVVGPLNLEETVLSAQTSEPEWLRLDALFTDVEDFDGTPVKCTLSQVGNVDQFALNVRVLSATPNTQIVDKLRPHLSWVLGLKDNLPLFYQTFADQDEPLSSTFSQLRGLRLMRGSNLYESLICSILSQNNWARLWNRSARLLMMYYGPRVEFPDRTVSFLFPKPEVLAKVTPHELRLKTSMGYRAESVVQVSRLIARGQLRLEELAECFYEEAVEILLDLPGVGPKVADCFLLYGVGKLEAAPVDVWIHRIVSKLYFGRKRVSRLKTARFLRERFEGWAGYAQLYLFDYARRTGFLGTASYGSSRSTQR